jgi:hypothetical protein
MADYDSSLPVRTENPADVAATIVDSTGANNWAIDGNNIGQVNLNDGTNALVIGANGEITSIVSDGTNTIVIDASGNLSTIITDGTSTLDINTDGSINVNVVESTVGDQRHVYNTATGVAPNTPTTVVTTAVTTAKTFILKAVGVASSGKAKFELKAGTPSSETVRAVLYLNTAAGFGEFTFPSAIEVVAGDNILVTGTNLDKANQDLYAWINGTEVTP